MEISLLDGSTFYNACRTSMEFVQILFMTFATAVYDTCPTITVTGCSRDMTAVTLLTSKQSKALSSFQIYSFASSLYFDEKAEERFACK